MIRDFLFHQGLLKLLQKYILFLPVGTESPSEITAQLFKGLLPHLFSPAHDHIFKEETGAEPVQAGDGNSKYRDMVESAATVETQIEALKAAVTDRIKQLESKNADQREIDKLRFALAFLSEGKLESAMLALRPE